MNDPLANLLIATQRYLADEMSTMSYKIEIHNAITLLNVNELRAFADVISTNSIHLRGRGH